MIKVFGIVVNMSIAASIAILAVILLRLMFRRAPKIFSYLLWMVVLIRLLYPVTLEADFGFLPDLNTVQIEDATYIYDADDVKIGDGRWSFTLPYEMSGILSVVWLIIGAELLFYEVISYGYFVHRLHKQPDTTVAGKRRVLVSEKISTPFVAGIFKPVIYLPTGLDAVQNELVMIHEKIHMKRLDYLIKPVFLFACCVHWFNPLVWLAFCLMIQDMESSCDEAVLQKIGFERKKEYACTLLELAQDRSWKVGYPIAFGENNVRSRVKNTVKAKKSATWVVAAVAFVAGMATVVLLVNGRETEESIVATDGKSEAGYQLAEEQTGKEQSDVQFLPNEEIIVTAVPGTDANEETTMHEYYMPEEGNETIDTDGTMTHLTEELEQGSTNGETIMNYEPARDKFAVLLLESPDAYYDLEILYRYPVEGASISSAFGTRIHPITQEERVHSGVDLLYSM